jgi:hypothetical protein
MDTGLPRAASSPSPCGTRRERLKVSFFVAMQNRRAVASYWHPQSIVSESDEFLIVSRSGGRNEFCVSPMPARAAGPRRRRRPASGPISSWSQRSSRRARRGRDLPRRAPQARRARHRGSLRRRRRLPLPDRGRGRNHPEGRRRASAAAGRPRRCLAAASSSPTTSRAPRCISTPATCRGCTRSCRAASRPRPRPGGAAGERAGALSPRPNFPVHRGTASA